MVGVTSRKTVWEGFSPLIKKKRKRDTLGENAHSCHWMLRCLELQQSSCAHEVKARRMAKKLTQKLDIVELMN